MPRYSFFFLWSLAVCLFCASAKAFSLEELSASLNVDPRSISVSGISSGAYMAQQLHVIHSRHVMGAGIIAGGPYRCAAGSYPGYSWFDVTGLYAATFRCSNTNVYGLFQGPPDAEFSIRDTFEQAETGVIDHPDNLREARVWLFSGGKDDVIPRAVVNALATYYRHFVAADDVAYVTHESANHAMITDDFGGACDIYAPPYINDCDIDAAQALLRHIYGELNAKASPENLQPIREFDQTAFFDERDNSVSMAETGRIYVPRSCAAGESCGLHLALHGCQQQQALIGDDFYADAGYNEWAETNNIIVLYPQTTAWTGNVFTSYSRNPKACWDWWGYSGENYYRKDGKQISALATMINTLVGEDLLSVIPIPQR